METVLKEKKGPRGYRSLILILNIVFALLIYWLLGFILDDISQSPEPDLSKIQKKYQNPAAFAERESVYKKSAAISTMTHNAQQQQTIAQASINSYRDTMNQLLDLQKVSIQKGIKLSPDSEKNLLQVTQLYLDYQKHFQDLNDLITKNNVAQQQLQKKIDELNEQLNKQNNEAYKEYTTELVRHAWALAVLQLLILIPLLLITFYLFRRYKNSIYKPIILAVGIPIFIKISVVMHTYLPSYFFKYILILILIYITAALLISKLRLIAAPNFVWLNKHYKESYQKAECPTCGFSITPSLYKFMSLENKKNWSVPDYLAKIDAYICPSCGELLFEKCTHCHHVRYSLLSFCDYCGMKKVIKND